MTDSIQSSPPPMATRAAGDLIAAAKRGDLDAVRALLDAGADLNQHAGRRGSRGTPLTWAAKRNRPAIVRELLARGADITLRDDAGRNALMWAAEVCPAQTVAELIACCREPEDNTADLINAVDAAGETALLIAASAERADVVRMLLGVAADLNLGREGGSGRSALARMAGSTKRTSTQLTALRSLLDAGADVNATDSSRDTPLILSCVASSGSGSSRGPYADGVAVTRLLLDAGADVNAQCSTGYTALMWAARAGATAQIRLLLDRGADPNLAARRPNGTTALLESAHSWCGTEPMELLLNAGANVNAQDSHGHTALMSAAFMCDTAQARLLLSRGADPTLRNKSGHTALECMRAEAVTAPESNLLRAAEAAEVKRLLREAEESV